MNTSEGRVVRAFHRFTLVDQSGGGRDLTKGRRRDQVGAVLSGNALAGWQHLAGRAGFLGGLVVQGARGWWVLCANCSS